MNQPLPVFNTSYEFGLFGGIKMPDYSEALFETPSPILVALTPSLAKYCLEIRQYLYKNPVLAKVVIDPFQTGSFVGAVINQSVLSDGQLSADVPLSLSGIEINKDWISEIEINREGYKIILKGNDRMLDGSAHSRLWIDDEFIEEIALKKERVNDENI